MKTFSQYGAMYAVANKDEIQPVPVELGDGTLRPGEFVRKLGHKGRTSFEMKDGYYLRYVGMGQEGSHKVILFSVNHGDEGNIYYAFYYLDRNTLIVADRSGCWDVRIERLEKFTEINVAEQLTLWEAAK